MNITGKYLKVWEVKQDGNRKKVNLGDSKKNQDGTYKNWTWFDCLLVGNAKNVDLIKGDKVEIKSGVIEMNESNGKWYTNIVIFEIERMERTGGPQRNDKYSQPEKNPGGFEDDIPF